MESICVVGGGSWATALVKIISEREGVRIRWWMRNEKDVAHIKQHRHNPHYLSSVAIHPTRVKPTTQLKESIKKSDWIILAVPAAFLADALSELRPEHFQNKHLVSAIKGMIPSTHQLVTDWMTDWFHIRPDQFCCIAGPCHAEEVALEKQSYLTIASPHIPLAEKFASLLSCRYVKASVLGDLIGVEYAAVMKNIIAVACGISHGMGSGDNFQAVLVSNAMQEIKRFVEAIHPDQRDLSSSAYLGDLLVTTYSQFSRNRTFGNMIGRGYLVKTAQMEMNMVAEGYYAVKSIFELNKSLHVPMPITDFAYHILYENESLPYRFSILKDQLT